MSKGLNFSVVPKQVSNLDNARVTEGIAQSLPSMEGEEYRWKVHTTLKTTKTVKPTMPLAELRAESQLQKEPSIIILTTDMWNATAVTDTTI
jgi:hypothetical protein